MKRSLAVCVALFGAGRLVAEGMSPTEPFKLGTFVRGGRTFVGLVLRDHVVVDLAAANAAFERSHPHSPKVSLPGDMKALIVGYEGAGVRPRLQALANGAAGAGPGNARPPYILDLSAVQIRPPVMPQTILNAAVNYTEHGAEMAARLGAGPTPPPPRRRGRSPACGSASPTIPATTRISS